MKITTSFFFAVFLIKSLVLFAQKESTYIWFDEQIGLENTDLFNGIEFTETYNILDKNHRFFETNAFTNGSLRYDDQDYFDISLKYDLYRDQLLVRLASQNGGVNQILLLNEKIESFKIGNTAFERLTNFKVHNNLSQDFYEVLEANDVIKLYKKNHKRLKKLIKNDAVYYKFIEEKPKYLILTDKKLHKINKRRDLVSVFPKFKKDLLKYKWTSKDFDENDTQITLAITMLSQALSQH